MPRSEATLRRDGATDLAVAAGHRDVVRLTSARRTTACCRFIGLSGDIQCLEITTATARPTRRLARSTRDLVRPAVRHRRYARRRRSSGVCTGDARCPLISAATAARRISRFYRGSTGQWFQRSSEHQLHARRRSIPVRIGRRHPDSLLRQCRDRPGGAPEACLHETSKCCEARPCIPSCLCSRALDRHYTIPLSRSLPVAVTLSTPFSRPTPRESDDPA